MKNINELGRRITIPKTSKVTKNKKYYTSTYHVPSVELLIGIGKDHTASLIMDEEAWEKLKSGEKLIF